MKMLKISLVVIVRLYMKLGSHGKMKSNWMTMMTLNITLDDHDEIKSK